MNASGAFYTIERLREQFRQRTGDPQSVGQAILEDVRHFLGQAPQNDDMCLVCFGRTAEGA
jgi:serine phosphatase RsbU (regulator of sigma subunit)